MPETLIEFDTKFGENMSSHNNTYIWTCQHSMRSHCCLKVELRIQALSDQIKITISYSFGRRGPFFLLRGRLRFIMLALVVNLLCGPRASTCRVVVHMWVKHFSHCRLNTEASVSKIIVSCAIQSYLYYFCVIHNFLLKKINWP